LRPFEKILPAGVNVVRIPRHDPRWLGYRENGIGASEVGTVLRLKYWDDFGIWRLWEEKIGLKPVVNTVNEYMHHGYYLEEYIADLWQYWDNGLDQFGEPSFVQRFQEYEKTRSENGGKASKLDFIVRACQRVNGFVTNNDFPNMFVSLDRWVYPEQYLIDFETTLPTGFPLECKNLSEFSTKAYVTGFPEYYHAQAQTQMALCRVGYMEFATLQGGNRFSVNAFEINHRYVADIVEQVNDFWFNNVMPAKEVVSKIKAYQAKGDIGGVEALSDELFAVYCPVPVETDVEYHYNYLTERAKRNLDASTSMLGTESNFQNALKFAIWDALKKRCERYATLYKNAILTELLENRVWIMDYGQEHGRISMVKPENAQPYPKVSLKLDIKTDIISNLLPEGEFADPDSFFNWE